MIAVIPVRDGVAPAGFDEAVSEAGGRVVVVGTSVSAAVVTVAPYAHSVWTIETTAQPSACAPVVVAAIRSLGLADRSVVLPASPDGRDLAPHLALALDRPLFSGALEVSPKHVSVSCNGGLSITDHRPDTAFVATLQVGVRTPDEITDDARVVHLDSRDLGVDDGPTAVRSLAVLPPDAATIDLGEAPRIVGGGAGLDGEARFAELAEVSKRLDASMGVTRVITDRGWVGHDRQIGTTGVVVDPDLYISFGISGAVQHTSGLGRPDHIISVNTDPHCPMMQLSDLAIVSDANRTLDELGRLLAAREGGS